MEALESERPIEKVYLQKDLNSGMIKRIQQKIAQTSAAVSVVPVQKLDRLAKGNNHQGVVAVIAPVAFRKLEEVVEAVLEKEKTPLFLLLDGVTDVRNLGAIMRTAGCTGVDAIIVPKTGSAPLNAEVVKTSAGAIFTIPVCKVDHLKDAVYYLKASGINIVAATEKTEDLLYTVDFRKPAAIIMGDEGRGVHSSLLSMADHNVKLPMTGNINSLNVSVACGAFLYEVVRQRQ
ncbi:23S rRNA (guanosine(2251)-2'-O)-methyltransferase RlmB [Gangjinia marincola]|uniref:23S rRNA (Guanosine(2251)-2'-O)-methyltransferase RlmB n=2 Tax=Gangjinia marincola TaxID=578463 RepID=A0ABN1MKF0_9FLAO